MLPLLPRAEIHPMLWSTRQQVAALNGLDARHRPTRPRRTPRIQVPCTRHGRLQLEAQNRSRGTVLSPRKFRISPAWYPRGRLATDTKGCVRGVHAFADNLTVPRWFSSRAVSPRSQSDPGPRVRMRVRVLLLRACRVCAISLSCTCTGLGIPHERTGGGGEARRSPRRGSRRRRARE